MLSGSIHDSHSFIRLVLKKPSFGHRLSKIPFDLGVVRDMVQKETHTTHHPLQVTKREATAAETGTRSQGREIPMGDQRGHQTGNQWRGEILGTDMTDMVIPEEEESPGLKVIIFTILVEYSSEAMWYHLYIAKV